MIMPFGKYSGVDVDDLPDSYVRWLWNNVALREPLRSAIEWRLDNMQDRRHETLPSVNLVKTVYRELSMKWHPDHGGHTMAQQAINEFYERLKQERGTDYER